MGDEGFLGLSTTTVVLGLVAVTVTAVAAAAAWRFRVWQRFGKSRVVVVSPIKKKSKSSLDISDPSLSALEALRNEAAVTFDPANNSHEQLLEDLWALLKPDVPRDGRVSDQWTEIGFQGRDPATDFRGMGVLSLKNIVYFARHFPEDVARVMRPANDPFAYPFAAAGINLTAHLFQLLKEHTELLSMIFPGEGEDVLGIFAELFCEEWIAFDDYYQLQIKAYLKAGNEPCMAIMEFNRIRTQFFTAQLGVWTRRLKLKDGHVGSILRRRNIARTQMTSIAANGSANGNANGGAVLTGSAWPNDAASSSSAASSPVKTPSFANL
eukprot:m.20542 g.20542  ORF g.20542 m.20542 type:complete len:324 (+) comp8740_c0_seq1:196-1167(+)